MTEPIDHSRRSVRVLLRQGHVRRRLQHKLAQKMAWLYCAIMMWVIRRPDKTALLYGRNDDEENILALALALTRTYEGRIIYLAGDVERTKTYLAILAPSLEGSRLDRVEVRARTSESIRRLHVRCQLVITSHILISSPEARGKRIHVHVSHGLGPKTYRNMKSSEVALVSNTTIWNAQHLQAMGKPAETAILSGYPRQDLLAKNSSEGPLGRIGIDPNKLFVVWAPTVRSAAFGGGGRWTEGAAFDAVENQDTWGLVPALRAAADRYGISLIAKPHPVEADAMKKMGLQVVTNDDIWAAGLSPYEFLGNSSGLISDYSSLWIDYLATDNPVGLYCPDLDEFTTGIRGLSMPPFGELASGLFISSRSEAEEFFRCVAHGRTYNSGDYQRVRKLIGYFETNDERSRKLVDEIQQLGAAKNAGLAFTINDH